MATQLPEGICYLAKFPYHHPGDNKPCLTARKIVIAGKGYKVGIWPPKQGKAAYFMRIDPIVGDERDPASNSEQRASEPQQGQNTRPAPAQQKESDPEEFFS